MKGNTTLALRVESNRQFRQPGRSERAYGGLLEAGKPDIPGSDRYAHATLQTNRVCANNFQLHLIIDPDETKEVTVTEETTEDCCSWLILGFFEMLE